MLQGLAELAAARWDEDTMVSFEVEPNKQGAALAASHTARHADVGEQKTGGGTSPKLGLAINGHANHGLANNGLANGHANNGDDAESAAACTGSRKTSDADDDAEEREKRDELGVLLEGKKQLQLPGGKVLDVGRDARPPDGESALPGFAMAARC